MAWAAGSCSTSCSTTAFNQNLIQLDVIAVIRTCLSLISFGFGLDRIIGAINASRFQGSDHTGLSVRLVSIGFVYVDQRSITVVTAVSLTIIGIIAFVLLVLGSPIG